MKAISFLLFALCVVLAGLCIGSLCLPLHAQDSPDSANAYSDDIVFTEIQLAPQGVTAVDTTGHTWHYNFTEGTFVQTVGGIAESGRDAEYGAADSPDDELSIEDRCTEELKLKTFEKTVLVRDDEYVDVDIVAYGRVTIKGWVLGDVKSIQNRVLVSESGRVDGDIEAPRVIIKAGGEVLGTITETGDPLDLKNISVPFSVDGLIIVTSISALFVLFGFLVSTLMPRQLTNMTECIRRYRVRTFLLGFMFVFLLPVVMAVVAITIVGIVLVPVIPLVYVVGFCFGVTAVGRLAGRRLLARSLRGERSMLVESMIGMLALIALWYVTAILLGASNPVSEGFGIASLVIAIIITAYPLMAGVGALVLTRAGFREYEAWRERQMRVSDETGMPAPPPIPETPSPPPMPQGPTAPTDNQTGTELKGGGEE